MVELIESLDLIREGCGRTTAQLKDLSSQLHLLQRGQRSNERQRRPSAPPRGLCGTYGSES